MKRSQSVRHSSDFRYDVTLSFAGEDRRYVREVSKQLTKLGARVFYDEYSIVDLWGKDLYVHLQDIYRNAARFCVLFISRHYAKKVWTNHERQSAQARAITQNVEYILPARFDNTLVPGLLETIGYVSLSKKSPKVFAALVNEKIKQQERDNYLPPNQNLLFRRLKVKSKSERDIVAGRAYNFFESLLRMTYDERKVIFAIFRNTCPVGLPDNVHMNIDLLHRLTKFPQSKIRRCINSIRSLGFSYRITNNHSDISTKEPLKALYVEWHDMSTDDSLFGNATYIAEAMISQAIEGYCQTCSVTRLEHLDFSNLSSITKSGDLHEKAG